MELRQGSSDFPLKEQARDQDQLRAALWAWLNPRLPHAGDLRLSALRRPKTNGVSNETILFDAAWTGGRRALVARLQTPDPLYLDASVERQFLVYEALAAALGVPVPEVLGYEPDPEVLGTPFFVMAYVEGNVPADNPHYTREGWLVEATVEERETLWRSAVTSLVAMHQVDTSRVQFLSRPDRGASGLEQDVSYWRSYYRWAAGEQIYPVMEAGEAWLLRHLPDAPTDGLSWGDSRLENMVFNEFRCSAVLDFESASLAGPEVDLAWWAIMDKGSARLDGLGTPQQTLALYEKLGGRPLVHLRYAMVLCAFRLAAIYIRLAAQLEARGLRADDAREMAHNSEKMQQLALLLEQPAEGLVTATLPDLDY